MKRTKNWKGQEAFCFAHCLRNNIYISKHRAFAFATRAKSGCTHCRHAGNREYPKLMDKQTLCLAFSSLPWISKFSLIYYVHSESSAVSYSIALFSFSIPTHTHVRTSKFFPWFYTSAHICLAKKFQTTFEWKFSRSHSSFLKVSAAIADKFMSE